MPLYRDTDFTWAFVAEERAGATRLIMRARIAYTPVWPATIVKALVLVGFGIGDVIQAGGMRDQDADRTESLGTHGDPDRRQKPIVGNGDLTPPASTTALAEPNRAV